MNDLKFYSRIDTRDTYLELWGGSTKHPDLCYSFSDYKDTNSYIYKELLVYQWLLYCASLMFFPSTSYDIAEFAQKYFDNIMIVRRQEREKNKEN